ncbi:hypothetical protein [Streptomyces sp. NBC_00236]|uniref:hypothetical protein n=1 Tax=Streptomyces sp. NBC_00236 TaxID=2903639 RepID=UPI002E2CBD01|nr:hypothetical protein [Streptomyces sp. NBC_00236]
MGTLVQAPGHTWCFPPQAVGLSARVARSAVRLAREGRLTALDVDPRALPDAALALLDEGSGTPEWARRFAADPVVEHREKLAACPGLPSDVMKLLAGDADVRVVAEFALWAPPEVAGGLAEHPHAEVRRAPAHNEATPPAVLAALVTGEGLPPARRCLVCDREETPFVHDRQCGRPDCDLLPGAACDGSHESTVFDMVLAALRNPATPTEVVTGFAVLVIQSRRLTANSVVSAFLTVNLVGRVITLGCRMSVSTGVESTAPYVEVSCRVDHKRGSKRRRPLLDCVTDRFEDAVPVRPFRWSWGGRHFPGWYWAATTGQHESLRLATGPGPPHRPRGPQRDADPHARKAPQPPLRGRPFRFALEVPRLVTAETRQLTDPITGELADLVEGLIGGLHTRPCPAPHDCLALSMVS